MKKLLVIVIVLFCSLKLSAAIRPDTTVIQSDSLKTSTIKKHKRTTKTSPKIKKADSLSFYSPANPTGTLVKSAELNKADSIKQALLIHQDSLIVAQSLSDSLKTLQLIKSTDSLKNAGLIRKDSTVISHPDSLKSPPVASAVTDSVKAMPHVAGKAISAPPNYHNTPVFYVSIDHPDGPRLAYFITYTDTIQQKIQLGHPVIAKRRIKLSEADSLQQQIRLIPSDSLRAALYTKLAAVYLKYDTISDPSKQLSYQDHALIYTLKSIHFYSRGNDTLGLRTCFNNLERVYFDQKKYPEAKWFILQSNTISRQKKDYPNIITSLLTLADIKGTIKDYKLAMRDLDEAIQISEAHHYQKIELDVFKSYAILYSRMNNYPKEAEFLKKRDLLDLSIQKSERDSLVAANAAKELQQKKKADLLLAKKKVYTSSIKTLSKSSSTKKTDTL
jgi:tetratricopeptide (TPR) repeat protein